MTENGSKQPAESIRGFALPRYEEIPDVGLYLEQTARYISGYLSCLGEFTLTRSMISNYVKMGLVANPVKKQYDRQQIAYLLFIAVAKTVLSLEDIRLLVGLQRASYAPAVAYDYFCTEMENVLFYTFGLKETLDAVGEEDTEEKDLLRGVIVTVAHKVYLDKVFARLHSEGERSPGKRGGRAPEKD